MKHLLIGVQALSALLGTVSVALAEEPASGGYGGTAYVWWALIVIIVAYGVYDAFFRPVD
jgi:hypothetical protein